jgi:hypothetical protein
MTDDWRIVACNCRDCPIRAAGLIAPCELVVRGFLSFRRMQFPLRERSH